MSLIAGKFIGDIEKKEVSSGDGSTTVFNLTKTPVSDTMVDVYLNGLIQTRNVDYTISAAAITFTTAPANAQEVYISYRFKD